MTNEAPTPTTHVPHTAIDTATGEDAPAQVSEDRVMKVFTEIAQQYEQFNHKSSFGQDHHWLDRLIQLAPVDSTTDMLDVAGGTGEVSFNMCDHKPPASILLTDFTPSMLEVADERLKAGDSHGVPVRTMVVDAQDMPLDDESFDVVTMAYGIRNMPQRQQALNEIYRVLKPGGTVCILEFTTPPNPVVRFFYKGYLRWGIPAWGKHYTGHREDFVYLAKSIRAFPNQETFAAMIREAGFADVRYENLTFGTVAIHTAVK